MDDCGVLNPDRVCMIGDTEHDLRGAINLNVYFLAVSYGSGIKNVTKEELNYKKFLGTVDNAINILDII